MLYLKSEKNGVDKVIMDRGIRIAAFDVVNMSS